MDINKKYDILRPHIKTGDLGLLRSEKVVGKTIRWCDNNAYNSHIVNLNWVELHGKKRLVIQHSTFTKPDISFLSNHINDYSDLTILRPRRSKEDIDLALQKMDELIESKHPGYDFSGGERAMLVRAIKCKLGVDVSWFLKVQSPNDFICSVWQQKFLNLLNIREFDNIKYPFPDDFKRYRNPKNMWELRLAEKSQGEFMVNYI